MKSLFVNTIILFLVALFFSCTQKKGDVVIISQKSLSSSRTEFGVQKLTKAIKNQGYTVHRDKAGISKESLSIELGFIDDYSNDPLFDGKLPEGDVAICKEGFALAGKDGRYIIAGRDDSGILYGCMELIERIKQKSELPDKLSFADAPKMKLRGTCIGIQKTYVIPEFGQYNYPYTPELFPFFYHKELWVRYLDMLLENRFNTLYLWNGHPFSSLVKLEDYPYAVDVDKETFKKNEEIFSFLTKEADKRGIWIIQKFYNIHVGKNFAEHNGIPPHAGTSTSLLEDYTRKSIAAFVEKYPNVGLLVTLGEALGPVQKDIPWLNEVIIPGVKEGLEKLETKKVPPIIIRGHNTDPPAVVKAALPLYQNLYTMSKYNGEALTTYEPRGPWAETHRELSRLGSTHIDNVHLLANLEPFRWASPDFIHKSVVAMHHIHGANGLHLYPQASYWDWPYSADKTTPRLYQLDRDWMWYKSWGRYAWNSQRDSLSERRYWSEVLGEFYGCTDCGSLILDALQESGECAPKGLRRFGITNGNRQCYTLGMFIIQLINREKFRPWIELWRSDSPEGEGLEEYVEKEIKGIPHKGETPPQIAKEIRTHGEKAVVSIEKASRYVTKNNDEFKRLTNDIYCTSLLANFYADKSKAAEFVLRYKNKNNIKKLDSALVWLEKSVEDYRQLTNRTSDSYLYAASWHTKNRKIPVSGEDGRNIHWTELLPMYEEELVTFRSKLAMVKEGSVIKEVQAGRLELKPVPFELLSEGLEKYTIKRGAIVFENGNVKISKLSSELAGLTGIHFSEKELLRKGGSFKFRVHKPVYVLVGYFNTNRTGFLPKPNLETNAHADDRGGLEPVLREAAMFSVIGMGVIDSLTVYPGMDVHAYKFEAGTHEMSFDKGRFLVVGVVDVKNNPKLKQSNPQVNIDWFFE